MGWKVRGAWRGRKGLAVAARQALCVVGGLSTCRWWLTLRVPKQLNILFAAEVRSRACMHPARTIVCVAEGVCGPRRRRCVLAVADTYDTDGDADQADASITRFVSGTRTHAAVH